MPSKWTYFSESEVQNLDTEFVAKLDMARHRAGVPFIITSGFRTPEINAGVGGVENSAHLQGLAVDLLCRNSEWLWHILDGLYSVGFKRIGIYFVIQDGIPGPSHVHVDASTILPQDVAWFKMEKPPAPEQPTA